MAPLMLLTFVSASLFLFVEANDPDGGDAGSEGECLTEINAAREAVGFSSFLKANVAEEGKHLPAAFDNKSEEDYHASAWKPVCEFLLPKTSDESEPVVVATIDRFASGTYAFKALESETPRCSDIVEEWKTAYNNFNGLPPPYSEQEQAYSSQENVSFVAMHNPSSDATADCRVVTCTRKTTTQQQNREKTGTTATEANGYALICMTTPDVLPVDGSKAPFTEGQWGQIVTAFEGSAPAVLPSLLSLTAAALAVALSVL
ncbi:SAG family member [Eimeria mitis]|uniref:SAG family member n=1 Tax=Eimeria mitis TaxID=44415 RepID=U6K649_9EIME|nr:SAG family member [Eimeria mitis]CDJ30948.1 SAG family member [Eimeria mitis]